MKLDYSSRMLILAGGVLQLITSYRMIFVKYPIFQIKAPQYAFAFIIAGIWYGIVGILMFLTARLLKKKDKFKKGIVASFVLSIAGLNIISLLGSVLGLAHILNVTKKD